MEKPQCESCRHWFESNPTKQDVQRFCSTRRCQRERHRLACQAYRRKNPDDDKSRRPKKEGVPIQSGNLRVDTTVAIAADANVAQAKTVALNVLKNHPNILKEPAPTVNVLKVADGAVGVIEAVNSDRMVKNFLKILLDFYLVPLYNHPI